MYLTLYRNHIPRRRPFISRVYVVLSEKNPVPFISAIILANIDRHEYMYCNYFIFNKKFSDKNLQIIVYLTLIVLPYYVEKYK